MLKKLQTAERPELVWYSTRTAWLIYFATCERSLDFKLYVDINIILQISEVAPLLHMVEVHKAGGDTLENIMAPYITLGTLDSFVD